jgi:hypothetical protein
MKFIRQGARNSGRDIPNQVEAAVLQSGRVSKYYNLKESLKSRDLRSGVWYRYKNPLALEANCFNWGG